MLRLEDFRETGLYLVFPDGEKMVFNPAEIKSFAARFLNDPASVPPEIKQAVDYKACSICPLRFSGEFCHALHPTLPYIQTINRYASLDPVTAVYRDSLRNFIGIKETTVQMALQPISVLSLIHYCEVGLKYRDYFMGLTPIMDFEEALHRIYLNIYWLSGGDPEKIGKTAEEFSREINITVNCQVKRLWLISKNDSFVNAFVSTHLITHFLAGNMEARLRTALEWYRSQSDADHGGH